MAETHDLLECLSRTSQGEVWRARDRDTGGIVAVKKPGGAAELVSIRHPQVVRVLKCHAEEMVMEWIENTNLEKLGRIDAPDFVKQLRHARLHTRARCHRPRPHLCTAPRPPRCHLRRRFTRIP